LGKVVIKDTGRVDTDYLYWLFLWGEFNREVVTSSSGTKILHTAPSRIEAFRFDLPPKQEQQAISKILGTLDDNIELNRWMNKTLEAMARALFKSWFVDFDPMRAKAEGRDPGLPESLASMFPSSFDDSELGETPNGWRVQDIYRIADVIYGAPFKSELFNVARIGRPLIRIRDLATHDPSVFTTEEPLRGHLVRAGDLVVGMDGEFRAHLWRGPDAWLNQRLCSFRPKPDVPRAFVHYSIEILLDFFERSKTGTTVIHLGKSDIDTFRVLVPPARILQSFAAAVDPLETRIIVTAQQSRTIATVRDTLLPKLVSGELRVKDAERFVRSVA
jgi:type I restriction enzyme S subunit